MLIGGTSFTVALWFYFDLATITGYKYMFNFDNGSSGTIFFRSNNGSAIDMYY